MRKKNSFFLILIILFAVTNNNAYAYVGPGLGLGVVGAIAGFIVSVLLAIVGFIWYPIRRIIKKKKLNSETVKSE